MKTKTFIAGLVAAMLASAANAATLSQTDTVLLTSSVTAVDEFEGGPSFVTRLNNQTGTLDAFDSSRGTLKRVEVTHSFTARLTSVIDGDPFLSFWTDGNANTSGRARLFLRSTVIGERSIFDTVECNNRSSAIADCPDTDTVVRFSTGTATYIGSQWTSLFSNPSGLGVRAETQASVRLNDGDRASAKMELLSGSITVRYFVEDTPPTTPVPLPAGLPLGLTALGALAWLKRRKG